MSRTAQRSRRQETIEHALGHVFEDTSLLEEALTHASAAGRGRRGVPSYERLEFLGDRVLGLAVAHLLIGQFPADAEGALTKRHAVLVSRDTLADVAVNLGVGHWLTVSRGEEDSGGRANRATLADTVEALIGAIYLDDGFPPAEGFVHRHWTERVAAMREPPREPKTALQEWAQGAGIALPSYDVEEIKGPPHAPVFAVVARLDGFDPARGEGSSKRSAEQAAATMLLETIEARPNG